MDCPTIERQEQRKRSEQLQANNLFTTYVEIAYRHLEKNDLLPEEHKGCHRNSRGTKDQLLIDNAVMKNVGEERLG